MRLCQPLYGLGWPICGIDGVPRFAPPHGILHAMEEKILGASGTVPFILDSAGVLSALDKAAEKGEYVGEAVAAAGQGANKGSRLRLRFIASLAKREKSVTSK